MHSRVRTPRDLLTCAALAAAALLAWAATAAAQAPPFVAPPAPGTQTVTRGFDLAHSFYSGEPAARPPLAIAWTADFPGEVSSPLVADGRVFVSARTVDQGSGTVVLALDPATGHELWRMAINAISSRYLGYAAGRLFVADSSGQLRALDPATGHQLWVVPVGQTNNSYPVATAELVYLQGNGVVDAFDAATGARRFQAQLGDGTDGVPGISGDRLYVLGPCRAAAFDRRNGSRIWLLDDRGCTGGGGGMASLFGHYVGGQDFFVDAQTGQRVAGRTAPAVMAGDVGISEANGGLEARDLETGASRWTFTPHDLSPALQTDGGSFLAAAGDSVLWRKGNVLRAVDRHSGALTWTGVLDRNYVSDPEVGGFGNDFAIGGGLVLLPTGTRLWALSDRAKDPPPTLDVQPGRLDPVVYGSAVQLTGTVTTTGLSASFSVGLQRDAWPFHGLSKPSSVTVDRGQQFVLRPKPTRNTLFRVAVAGTDVKRDLPVVVLPHVTSRRVDHGPGGRGRIRFHVIVPRGVRLAGRPVVLYVWRAKPRRYERLGAGRLHGRRGSFHAEFSFHTVAHFAAGDFVAQCVRGLYRQGMSFGDRLDHRCGARRVA